MQYNQSYEKELDSVRRANHRETNQVRMGFQEKLMPYCCLKDEKQQTVYRVSGQGRKLYKRPVVGASTVKTRDGKKTQVATLEQSEEQGHGREEAGQLRIVKAFLKSFVLVFILRTIRIY